MTTTTRDAEPQTLVELMIQDARVLNEVVEELRLAREKFTGTFASAHEGYAVILEELDELKTECFKRREERTRERLRAEAIQVAAMAVRFAADLT